ncbi:MAG: PolC-type DNA polymerase III [Acutalibacter sp.]|jgi:DNA polymerase-3 subunit epsilon
MPKVDRPGKGESRMCLPRDYTVVDTETTGLSSESCSLIEVSALRVREGQVQEEFSTLLRPPWREVQKNGEWTEGYVDDFIQGLTGITDEMLEDAPLPEDALPQVEEFLGEDLLLGHNVGFDTAFLYDSFQKYLGHPLRNDSLDHLRIARKLLPELPHHRLGDVAAALHVPYEGAHRALQDCWITYGCYEKLRALALSRGTEEEFVRSFEKKRKPPAPRYPGVPGHPFYRKEVVLTGSLATPENRDAVLRAGGRVGKEVTPRTAYVAIPALGEVVLPGREGGPAILPQGAFYRMVGQGPSGGSSGSK